MKEDSLGKALGEALKDGLLYLVSNGCYIVAGFLALVPVFCPLGILLDFLNYGPHGMNRAPHGGGIGYWISKFFNFGIPSLLFAAAGYGAKQLMSEAQKKTSVLIASSPVTGTLTRLRDGKSGNEAVRSLTDVRDPALRREVADARRKADVATIEASVAQSEVKRYAARQQVAEAETAMNHAAIDAYGSQARLELAKYVRDQVVSDPARFAASSALAAGLGITASLPSAPAISGGSNNDRSGADIVVGQPARPILTPDQIAEMVIAAAAENGASERKWMEWSAGVAREYPDQMRILLDAAARLREDGGAS